MTSTRTKLALGTAGLAVIVGALLLGTGIGYASDKPVKRGDVCTQIGQERKDRSGDVYVCQQKPSDPCPRFHAKYPGGGGSPLPPCVCPSKSPSASASVSPSASKSPSSSPSSSPSMSPSKPASGSASTAASPSADVQPSLTPASSDGNLPVTGTRDVVLYGGIGLVLVGFGVFLRFGPRIFRRRNA